MYFETSVFFVSDGLPDGGVLFLGLDFLGGFVNVHVDPPVAVALDAVFVILYGLALEESWVTDHLSRDAFEEAWVVAFLRVVPFSDFVDLK